MALTDWLERNGFVKLSNERTVSSETGANDKSSPLPPVPTRTSNPTKTSSEPVDTSKFDEYFSGLFKKANLPGPDYYEFWKLMQKLESRVPDRRDRVIEAFEMLGAISHDRPITKNWLIETARKYIDVILSDRKDTQADIDRIKTEQIGSLSKEIELLESTVMSCRQEIKSLERKIDEASKLAEEKRSRLKTETEKLEANSAGYFAASAAAADSINSDISIIETTLN